MWEKLYRIKEASEILGVHPKTLQRLARGGKIRVVKTIGGIRRIPESEIRSWVKKLRELTRLEK